MKKCALRLYYEKTPGFYWEYYLNRKNAHLKGETTLIYLY